MGIDPISLAITVALNAAMMAVTMSKTIEGPRLTDLNVTVADYGTPLSYVYGIRRVSGVVFYAEPIKEEKKTHKGKGGKYVEYKYFGTFAVAVADHAIQHYRKCWLDKNLVYDATANDRFDINDLEIFGGTWDEDKNDQFFQLFYGEEDQEPPERMVATVEREEGPDTCPAYLGVSYVFFEDLPLEDYANRFPQFSAEISTYDQYHTEIVRGLEGGDSIDFGNGYFYNYTSPNGQYTIWNSDVDYCERFLTINNTRGDYQAQERNIYDLVDGETGTWGVPLVDNDRNVYFSNEAGTKTYKVDYEGTVTQIGSTGDLATASGLYGLYEIAGTTSLFYMNRDSKIFYRRDLPSGTPVEYNPGTDLDECGGFVQDGSQNVWAAYTEHATVAFPGVLVSDIWFFCVGGPDSGDLHNITGLPAVYSSDISDYLSAAYYNGNFYVILNNLDQASVDKSISEIDSTTFTVTRNISQTAAGIPIGTPGAANHSGFLGPSIDTSRNHIIVTKDYFFDEVGEIYRIDIGTGLLATETVNNWPPIAYISRWQRRPPSADKDILQPFYPFTGLWNDTLGAMTAITYVGNSGIEDYPRDLAYLYIDDPELVYLSDICNDVAQRLDMDENDYDFLDLDQVVTGYSWTQGAGKDIVGKLLHLYDSDIRPNGFVLEGIKRGNDDEGDAIGYDWFVRNESNPSHTLTMASESDLTRRMFLTFSDMGADEQPNTAVVQRSAGSVLTRRETSLDLSNWSSTAANAQQLLERVMRRSWVGSVTLKASLPPHYLRMLPAGVRTFNLRDDLSFRGRLTRMSIGADRVIDCAWEQDSAVTNTTRDAPGGVAAGIPPQTVLRPVDSVIFILDIPLLADTQDQSTPFAYVAGAPIEEGDWPGVDIQMSESGSEDSYNAGWDGVPNSGQVTWGTILNPPPSDVLTSVVDWGTVFIVQFANGDPTSYTEDEILANQSLNQFIVGARDRWVIGQFCTATIQSDGEYVLHGIIWGARGTERHVGGIAAGDQIVLVSSGVKRHDMGASKISDPDWYKGVTFLLSDTQQAPLAVTFSAAANRPLSPVHVELTKEANGDWTITWLRRTRIGGALLDGQDVPLGETSEAYKVRILEGISGTALRTIETTIEEATYTLAMQTADFGSEQFVLVVEIVQMSPVLGIEGYETLAYV